MRRLRTLLVLALFACLLPLSITVSGCTVIGYNIGSQYDRQHPPLDRRIATADAIRLERGDACALFLTDSTLVRGVFLGVAPADSGAGLNASRLMISTARPGERIRWGETGDGMHGISKFEPAYLDTAYVPIGQVRYVLVPSGGNGVVLGTLLGLTADVAVVVGVKHSLDHGFDCGTVDVPNLFGGLN